MPSTPHLLEQSKSLLPMLELQTAVELDEFWRATKRLLSAVMPHQSCSLLLGIVDFEPQEGRHHVAISPRPGNRPINSLSIAKPFLAVHPQLKVYTYGDILKEDPQVRRRRKEREKHFTGWDQFVHLAFWDGDRPDAVLSVRRTAQQGDFSPMEREFLAFLHPTLDAGLRRLRKLHRERERGAAMESYMRALPMPVVFVEADGEVAFATQQACELCAVWNHGLTNGRAMKARSNFRLPRDVREALRELAVPGTASKGEAVLSAHSGRRVSHPQIQGLSAQIDLAQAMKGPWGRPGFWITFMMTRSAAATELECRPQAATLLQLLSPSERQVALLVSSGKRNQEIARELGKSLRTVEFQLNAIFRKLGLTSRTQLVRALL